MLFPSLAGARQALRDEVFKNDERHLASVADRHLQCARQLSGDSRFIAEAEFHTLMACECLFKMLFCLLRYSNGFRANASPEFAKLRLAEEWV
jgi:hypothetical protein